MKLKTRYGKKYEIKFDMDKYYIDNSTYICALIMENGEVVDFYGDVTTCIPYSVGEDEILLDSNNSPDLIREMERVGLIKMTGNAVQQGFGKYLVAKLTDKFESELIKGE